MKTYELKGTLRSEYGKKAAKALRKQDLVPCNLYGQGKNITFVVNQNDTRKMIYTPDTLIIALDIEGEKHMAVLKETQFHPITGNLLHADFLEVSEQKPVVVEIPIQLEGHAEGVKAGGKLSLEKRKLKVKGIYTNFPDRLVIDVTPLGLGKKMQVADLHYDNLELVNVKEQVVVQVKATRASAQAAQEA